MVSLSNHAVSAVSVGFFTRSEAFVLPQSSRRS